MQNAMEEFGCLMGTSQGLHTKNQNKQNKHKNMKHET